MTPTRAAKIPAAATPPTQPRMAQKLFLVNPSSSSRQAAAVTAAMATVRGSPGRPRMSPGISKNHTQARVNTSPSRARIPFQPPSRAKTAQKTKRVMPITRPRS